MHPLTFLLIDDSETDRATYRRFLNQSQYTYHFVEFDLAETALEWCQTHTPDLILLDYQLPDLDGLEFLSALQQQTHQLEFPLIFLTAYSSIEIAVEAMKRGAQDYLAKDRCTAAELQIRVQGVLEKTRLKQILHLQREYQHLVSTTALRIRQSLSLPSILQTTVEEVRALLSADRVIIYQFSADWSGEVVVESVGEDWLPILGEVIDDPCIENDWAEPYYQGHITHHANIAAAGLADCYVQLMQRFQVQANLSVPIVQEDQLWGLLIVHQCSGLRQWQDVEIALLRDLTVQLSIALGQVSLHEHLQTELIKRQQSEIRFQRMFEQSPEGKVRFALDGSVIAVNRAWEKIWETTADTIEGYNILQDPIIISDGKMAAVMRAFAGESVYLPPFFHDPTQLNRSARSRWIDVLLYPVKDLEEHILEVVMVIRDVTDRKQAEAALRESWRQIQQQLAEIETIYQNAPIGLGVLNAELQFVRINKRLAEMNGFSVEEHIGHTVRELLPDVADTAERLLRSILETGEPQFNVEINGETPAQPGVQRLWVEHFLPLRDGDRIVGVSAVCEEVTEQRQAQKALEQSEARLRLAQTASNSAVWDWDIQTNTIFWSPEYYRLYELKASIQPSYENWLNCIHPDDREKVNQQTLQALRDSHPYVRVEFRVTRSDGLRWFAAIGQVLRDASAKPIRMIGIVIDMTPQKQAEIALQELNNALEQRVMERTQELSVVNDRLVITLQEEHQAKQMVEDLYQQVQLLNTGLEFQVNKRTAQLQQALDFEALLKRITDRVRDSLDEQQILQAAVEELAQELQLEGCDTGIYNPEQTTFTIAYESVNTLDSVQGSTFEIATSPHPEIYADLLNGRSCQFSCLAPHQLRSNQRFLCILAVPLIDDQGVLGDLWLFKQPGESFDPQEVRLVQQVANQCAIALRQSRLYQAAQGQVQELERLNQLKDDFLSTVSHELRTPMSSIKMAVQMLEVSLNRLGVLTDTSAPIHRYFNILREEGQREISLINDLLDLTRLDAGIEPLEPVEMQLQIYVPHLVESFIEKTQQQQQQLIIQIPETLPPLVIHLPYLERILTELLNNACKYTPLGETITISAQTTSESIEICVSNSGVEIPSTEYDRIFDKFYRIPNNDPWKHGGTGLGLALVTRMVKQLQGSITVHSGTQPRMTVFTVRFPQSENC